MILSMGESKNKVSTVSVTNIKYAYSIVTSKIQHGSLASLQ